jgi:ferredoxin
MTEQKELKVEDIKKNADEIKCPVQRSLYFVTEFLAGPMCGRCFPCSMGSYEARIRLLNLASGEGTEADLHALKRIAGDMLEASMCKKGKDTAKFILEWMGTDVSQAHVGGKCPDKDCLPLIRYLIIPEKCTMCGLCMEVCKDNAIFGRKKKLYMSGYLPFEVRQKRCTKCGECIKVCPEGAIELVDARTTEPVGA